MRLDTILRVVSKLFIPFILVFGLYVQWHGDYSPGGGFQAGVILAAGFILYGLIFGMPETQRVLPPRVARALSAIGVLIWTATGLASIVLGHNFLDYDALRHDPVHGQHLGILLVELGVITTVFGVMVSIFYAFGGRPEAER